MRPTSALVSVPFLAEARRRSGLSQMGLEELSRLHRDNIAQIELRGTAWTPTAAYLAERLGCTLEMLVGSAPLPTKLVPVPRPEGLEDATPRPLLGLPRLLEARGLSRQDLAALLGHRGANTVGCWLNKRKPRPVRVLSALAVARTLGVSLDELWRNPNP